MNIECGRYGSSAYLNSKAAHFQLWAFQDHVKKNANRANERAILFFLLANAKPSNSPFIIRRPQCTDVK